MFKKVYENGNPVMRYNLPRIKIYKAKTNRYLLDRTLTLSEKGMLAYLSNLPEGSYTDMWEIYENNSGQLKKSMQPSFNALIKKNYIHNCWIYKEVLKDDGISSIFRRRASAFILNTELELKNLGSVRAQKDGTYIYIDNKNAIVPEKIIKYNKEAEEFYGEYKIIKTIEEKNK